ncbi:MAG: C39 family peptidase [Microgenomates group bacterium]
MFSRLQNTIRRPGQTLLVLFAIFAFQFFTSPTHAAVCGEEVPRDEGALKTYIADCNDKLSSISGQKQTLASAIDYLNTQIKITQAKVSSTTVQLDRLNIEISDLSGTINSLDLSLDDLTKVFISRVRQTYMHKTTYNTDLIAQTSGVSDLLRGMQYNKKMRDHDQLLLLSLEKSRLDASSQKEQKVTKQKEIIALKTKLDIDKAALSSQIAAKNKLLADTKNDEARFQQLKSSAQAQLNSLAGYAESVGITLLPHQELSDTWGKYYNQRDSQWGSILVNGDPTDCRGGSCTIARIGCLVTSYAMVVSHFGGSSLPSDVAINSSNFSLSSANFNNPGPSANGHSVTSLTDPSIQQLRDALNSGKIIIAGLSINGGPAKTHYSDHWVVLRSVDGDSFKINDPVYPGAMNVSLKDHYASWTIIQARVYN